MQDVPQMDSLFRTQVAEPLKLQCGDKISIIVSSSIPELANIFNMSVPYRFTGALSTSSTTAQTAYYTVDDRGEVDFPILGKISVVGLSRLEVSDRIKQSILDRELLKDVVVAVEYANLTYSVLGDVTLPGRYSFDKDRLTLLDALSMAKDMTITGRRSDVLVSRRLPNGMQKTYRVDLRDTKTLYASEAFYIQQNDVIYVVPNSMRARQSSVNGNTVLSTSFWISVASLATSIAVLILK